MFFGEKRMFLLMHQHQERKENNELPLGNKSITRKRNTCFFSLLKGIQRTKVAWILIVLHDFLFRTKKVKKEEQSTLPRSPEEKWWERKTWVKPRTSWFFQEYKIPSYEVLWTHVSEPSSSQRVSLLCFLHRSRRNQAKSRKVKHRHDLLLNKEKDEDPLQGSLLSDITRQMSSFIVSRFRSLWIQERIEWS